MTIKHKLASLPWKKIMITLTFIFLAMAPFFLSDFRTNLLGKFICYGIIALGLDMLWGYTGILSLGHGVFFGLGAYCMAMYLKLEGSGGKLVDFMKWSGLESLPNFWKPFAQPGFALIMVILAPTLLALIIGFLTFKNRIKGVYFSILSQAIAIIATVLLVGQQAYTGGSNGLTHFSTIFGFNIVNSQTKLGIYYTSLLFLILAYLLCQFLINRRIGKVLIAIRDGENRVRFSGYNPTSYKVFIYCLSAALAGIAGALYVPQVGIISPNEMSVTSSIEMIIWVAIGGKGTLVGAILGALLVNASKTLVSENFPEIWSYFIGVIFILVMLYMPNGLAGAIHTFKEHLRKRKLKIETQKEGSIKATTLKEEV